MMEIKKGINSKYVYFLFTLPALILYSVFYVWPVFTGLYYSFTDWNGLSKKYNIIGFKNYINVLKDGRFRNSISLTFFYTILLVVFVMAIALALALLLNSKIKHRNLYRAIYFFPTILSLVTVGLIWNQIFYAVIPSIGKALNISWLSHNILGNAKTALFGVLIVNVWQGVAIPLVIILAGLQSVPADLYEAALLDGASTWEKFKNITFPHIVPVLNVALVITMKAGFTVFDYIQAMTGGGPGYATESIGVLIYKHGMTEMKFGYGAAESFILFLIIALISFIQIKYLDKKGA